MCAGIVRRDRVRTGPVNAAGLRAALAATCDLDGRDLSPPPLGGGGGRVYIARNTQPIPYADGAESYVGEVIANATDLATGSPELAREIRDWPSQYHLSGARANLLRPLALSGDLSVLEIGAGCGAITRYLGEACGTVLAIEGSLARARIAAQRCRNLDNVVVACGPFPDIAFAGEFDLVTLVGVVEYARV